MGWWSRHHETEAVRRHFAEFLDLSPHAREQALAGAEAPAWIAAAAQYGLVEAQLLHGQLLLDRGDPALALRWFRAAAEANHPPAQNMVGRCLEKGWGTAPDLPEAARHYRLAAEAGLDWAQFNLGMVLLYGIGLERDRIQAHTWFERAVAQGHAKAANMLGRFHEEGWDRPPDMAAATSFYRMAAEGGDFRARFNLATIYLNAGRRADALPLLQAAWAEGSPDFKEEAGAALRNSGDPDLLAIAVR